MNVWMVPTTQERHSQECETILVNVAISNRAIAFFLVVNRQFEFQHAVVAAQVFRSATTAPGEGRGQAAVKACASRTGCHQAKKRHGRRRECLPHINTVTGHLTH